MSRNCSHFRSSQENLEFLKTDFAGHPEEGSLLLLLRADESTAVDSDQSEQARPLLAKGIPLLSKRMSMEHRLDFARGPALTSREAGTSSEATAFFDYSSSDSNAIAHSTPSPFGPDYESLCEAQRKHPEDSGNFVGNRFSFTSKGGVYNAAQEMSQSKYPNHFRPVGSGEIETCPAGMMVDESFSTIGPSPPPIGAANDFDLEDPAVLTRSEIRIQRNEQQLSHWNSLIAMYPGDPLAAFWREQCSVLEGLLLQRQRVGHKRAATFGDFGDHDDEQCYKRTCNYS